MKRICKCAKHAHLFYSGQGKSFFTSQQDFLLVCVAVTWTLLMHTRTHSVVVAELPLSAEQA